MARPREGHVVVAIEGPNAKEAENWSTQGRSWIEHEAVQDQILAPVTQAVLDLAGFEQGERVLDVGCGTGAHALAVAEAVVPDGEVLALDVSAPFLDRVAERAKTANLPIRTRLADAQTADWSEQFDALTSRFGVMFFADPSAAFRNLARPLRPGGRMVFAAWAPVSVNPFWRLPLAVASDRLGAPPPTPPNAPGPMGLADKDYVVTQLAAAGLTNSSVDAHQVRLGSLGTAEQTASHCLKIGSGARIIRMFDGTDRDRAAIEGALAEAFRAYQEDGLVSVPATLNIIQATVT